MLAFVGRRSLTNGLRHDIGLWQRELAHGGTPPDALVPFNETGVVRS